MATHTPGPWVVHPRFKNYVVPAGDAEKSIGGADDPNIEAERYAKQIVNTTISACDNYPRFYRSRVTKAEGIANARLIAAAPDLLAALKALLTRAERELADPQDVWEVHTAHEAIEKAEAA